MSRHLRNSSCSSAVQRPVALGMDLASRARAPVWALLDVFGGASVLDVNLVISLIAPLAARAAVVAEAAVGCSGRAGVRAAGGAGTWFSDIKLFDEGLLVPEKGAKRCAAGFSASMDKFERPERPCYVPDALKVYV